jgi:hypothetical protein
MHLSYTLSSQLKETLTNIDTSRARVLLSPLSLEDELHIRWQTLVSRVWLGLTNTGSPVAKSEINATLSTSLPKNPPAEKRAILAYKLALDAIAQDWLATNRPITPATLAGLYALSSETTYGKLVGFRSQEKNVGQALAYLESEQEHPVVQAAAAYLLVKTSSAFGPASERMAILTTYLFLYRRGYDVRGTISFEEELFGNKAALAQAVAHAETTGSATLMLELLARCIAVSLRKTATTIGNRSFSPSPHRGFFRLSERQKDILAALSHPEATITNSLVQKRFRVSQITASRDLAKLASFGLLFAHGRGRSTYYMKT